MSTYRPTALAISTPRRYFIEQSQKWVGIGGAIQMKNQPPKLPAEYTVAEATPDEYKMLFEQGLTHLVSKSDAAKRADIRATQSDTGVDQ